MDVPKFLGPWQSSLICAGAKCRSQAQNISLQISPGIFNPNLYLTSITLCFSAAIFFSRIPLQLLGTFIEVWPPGKVPRVPCDVCCVVYCVRVYSMLILRRKFFQYFFTTSYQGKLGNGVAWSYAEAFMVFLLLGQLHLENFFTVNVSNRQKTRL